MKKWLLIILLIGFFYRLYQANVYPPISWDEASLGYNSYSILKTGKDEYGNFLPLVFKSFGDYKPGLYVYLTLPFVAIFGLNPLSVRLPSIILGSLLPLLLYLFIKHFPSPHRHSLALLSLIICTFNPWNIHFSKGAWESNIFLFELLFATYLFYKNRYLLSSSIFALTLFTYQSAKLTSLLLILVLIISQYFSIKKNINSFIIHFLPPIIISSILIIMGLVQHNGNRLQVLSLFSYPRNEIEKEVIINETSVLNYKIFYNKYIFFSRNFISRYLNYFSPQYLFFQGDWQNARHSAPYIGLLLYPSLIFIFIGIFALLKIGNRSLNLFLLFWLFLAPIASALTRDSVHAVRSLPLSIPLIYYSSLGILYFIKTISLKLKYIFIISISCSYLLSFIYFTDLYFNHMVQKSPADFLTGYQPAINFLNINKSKYSHVYFSDYYGQPYIYYLFYSQYPPHLYQTQAFLLSNYMDTGKVENIDNIRFQPINFDGLKTQPNSLLIISLEEMRRQNLLSPQRVKDFIPLGISGDHAAFYAYETI